MYLCVTKGLAKTFRTMDLSIIVPLYNEEESVVLLHEAIKKSVDKVGFSYEILFVDDGSKDNTVPLVSKLVENDKHLRIIKFRRNYGQTPAMAAGIDNARGEILVTMDGDLQNDPDDIPELVSKVKEGYDIVVGWRHNRQDKLLTRKIPSKIANKLIGKVTGVPIKDNGCSLKAYRSHIIKNIPLYSEMHRFIPAMTSLAGTKIAEVKVNHHARAFGESKYGLSRIYKVLIDLLVIKTILTSFSKPLRMFAAGAAVSLTAALTFLIIGINQIGVSGGVIFFGTSILYGSLAFFLLFWGILGELVYQTGNLKLEHFAQIKREV